MRIIGGKHRGRKLNRVGLDSTRETADMVRESVFNMLNGYIEGNVLDLFAGSGAYGFEALSRGANHAFLVDHQKEAIKTMIENTKILNLSDHVTVVFKDYNKYLDHLDEKSTFDMIFLDPPYDLDVYEDVIARLAPYTLDHTVIICESKKQNTLPDEIQGFHKFKEKVYGIKRVSIYQK